jgi:hypothetical protein
MQYAKYLTKGQKAVLRVVQADPGGERFEALTSRIRKVGPGVLELELPYAVQPAEAYPLSPGTMLDLGSEHLGVGVKATCTFLEYREPGVIWVRPCGDLVFVQRRVEPRLNASVGVYSRLGRGTLRTFRDHWARLVRDLDEQPGRPAPLPVRPAPVNLSVGGIRIAAPPDVQPADLCLLLLRLSTERQPICALSEVVWTGRLRGAGRPDPESVAGMQFMCILERDRRAISWYVREGTVPAGRGR